MHITWKDDKSITQFS